MALGIVFMILPTTIFGYLFIIGFMKSIFAKDEDAPTWVLCSLIPFLLPFAAIYGTIFAVGFDVASVIFPFAVCFEYPLFHRYPKLRKLLESVFESLPQAILQLYIVVSGILEDNVALVVVSMLTSMVSAVVNLYMTYSASQAVEDGTFVDYVLSLALSITTIGTNIIPHARELRDGLKQDATWIEEDIKYDKDKSFARPTAVRGNPETEKMRRQGLRIEEVDELPEGTPLRVDTFAAWEGWWGAQLIGIDRLRTITMPLAFFSDRAAHLFGQCIANSQYIQSVTLSHCYLCATGQVFLARGLACASTLQRFETTVDFAAFIAGCLPGGAGGGDAASAEFWKGVNTAVYRERVKENRANRTTAQGIWAALTLKDWREGSPDKLNVDAVVFPGMVPLGCVFVLAGCSALNLFNETLAISAVREAAHQAKLDAKRQAEEAADQAKKAGGKPPYNTNPAHEVASPHPATPRVEQEEGGAVKGLAGTSERAQPLTFMGITSPGIDLLPPRQRELI
ncbi:unnamed protein product, partial [Symbiodinium sp. KB8]